MQLKLVSCNEKSVLVSVFIEDFLVNGSKIEYIREVVEDRERDRRI